MSPELIKHNFSNHYKFFYFAILVLTICITIFVSQVCRQSETDEDKGLCSFMFILLSIVYIWGIYSACIQFKK